MLEPKSDTLLGGEMTPPWGHCRSGHVGDGVNWAEVGEEGDLHAHGFAQRFSESVVSSTVT